MTPLVLRGSRWRYVLLLLVSAAFVAVGTLLVMRTPNHVVGWANIGFFGLCAATFLWQIVDARPRLVIDERGVFDRTLRVGVIPWSEIVDVEQRSMMGQAFVALALRDPSMFTRRLPGWQRALTRANRAVGFEALNLNLVGLQVDPDVVVARLRQGMTSLAGGAPVGQNPPA